MPTTNLDCGGKRSATPLSGRALTTERDRLPKNGVAAPLCVCYTIVNFVGL